MHGLTEIRAGQRSTFQVVPLTTNVNAVMA
jgi:hypothetical protein